jgi:hypothetical protein
MSMSKISVPVVTYCVPAHDVQTVPDCETFDYLSPGVLYPSASATYFSDPTEDPDFCDIIADLAQDELYDFSWGLSAVALPVDSAHENAVSAVSIAVPESDVSPYDDKGIVIAANAVNAFEDEDFKMKYLGWEDGVEDINEDAIVMKKKANDQKLRRDHAVQRLKEKRRVKKSVHVVKSVGSTPQVERSVAVPVVAKKPQPAVVTARQAAAAHRERVKGKFKHNNTRWVSVSELMRQTNLRDHQEEEHTGTRLSTQQPGRYNERGYVEDEYGTNDAYGRVGSGIHGRTYSS